MYQYQTKEEGQYQYSYQSQEDPGTQALKRFDCRLGSGPGPGGSGDNGSFSFKGEASESGDDRLKTVRSKTYMEALEAVDLLTSTDEEIIAKLREHVEVETAEMFQEMSQEDILEEIMASVREEFDSREVGMSRVEEPEYLKKIISRCLIEGCDFHSIDRSGIILEHYKKKRRYDKDVDRARRIFKKYPEYRYVEVYNNCCRLIAADGTVKKIMNGEV